MAFNTVLRRQLVAYLPNTAQQLGGVASIYMLKRIGKREIVGYGWNGSAEYDDRLDFPLPPIRFREETNEIKVLREKEKSDWKKLTLQEKKALYRASFCQTLAEVKAPSGDWKMSVGFVFLFASLSIWAYILLNIFVFDEMPITFDEEHQKAQLKRMLELEVNPITGISSKWDYEKNKWK